MPASLQSLSPEEELLQLREIYGLREPLEVQDRIVQHFMILQARAGMMVSLIALCMTISGFSGHRISSAGRGPTVFMCLGLLFAVVAATLLFAGPLQLRWTTAYRHPDGMDARLVAMIRLRNLRTRRYHIASGFMILGLSCYLGALVFSLFPGSAG